MIPILARIQALVWGLPTLGMILAVGIYLTLGTGFAQLTLFPRAWKAFWAQFRDPRETSSLDALCTALAATVGTGNIAGVAGAIALGGPGTLFWMWVCAALGMILKFAEATLAVRYRVPDGEGGFTGGPMYMIRQGMGAGWKPLATVYCFFGVVAACGVGNATQINSVVTTIREALPGIPDWGNALLGAILALMILPGMLGGSARIGRVARWMVPVSAAVYMALCLGVVISNPQGVGEAFRAILEGAFQPRAVTGGVVASLGQTLRVGISRGVFTNEAGMGTAGIAHGGAQVAHPAQQGLMGIMEVFWDTVVMCTLTGLAILVSGVPIPYGRDEGAALTARAFSAVYGGWVQGMLALCLCAFAVATVLGWGLYGGRCAQFLFGSRAWGPFVLLQGLVMVLGGVLQTGTVWILAEIVNGLMAIPNLLALGALSPEVFRLTRQLQERTGSAAAQGGTYANIHQCQSLRTVPHAEIPPAGGGGEKAG